MSAVLERLPPFDSDAMAALWSKDFPATVSISYSQVYYCLVELRSKTDNDRQRNSFKSMKGYSYFTSGWVESVWICEPPLSPLGETDATQATPEEQAPEPTAKVLHGLCEQVIRV